MDKHNIEGDYNNTQLMWFSSADDSGCWWGIIDSEVKWGGDSSVIRVCCYV